MLYNEVKPITILMSEKNKNKNLRQDCKKLDTLKARMELNITRLK